MPNWVTNIMKFTGDKTSIENLFAAVRTENSDFSFEKIIPMPKTLNLPQSSSSSMFIAFYLNSLPEVKRKDILDELAGNKQTESHVRDYFHDKDSVSEENLLSVCKCYDNEQYYFAYGDTPADVGKQYVENLLVYKHATWYGWSCEHWGTKWDACGASANPKSNEIRFTTAWSRASDEILLKLSEMFPETRFTYHYADEDFGSNVGALAFFNGTKVFEDRPISGSKEAIRLAGSILGREYEED